MRLKSSLALALIGTLVFAPGASAHDLLIDISPASAEVVTEKDFEARLTFNNPLLVVAGESNSQFETKLVGANSWIDHEVLISDRILTARVSLSEPGQYDLRWSVVSSDGHPISGESNFTLEIEAPAEGTDESSPSVIAPAPTQTPADSERSLVGFYVGLAMVVLGVIFAPIGLIIRRRAKKS
jgi:methionine-rich copper-binding protein CopC